ncbi:MAG: NAD(+)/NADH kinase [Thermoplasmata archaeon]
MRYGLVVHPRKPAVVPVARHIAERLASAGDLVVADTVPEAFGLPGERAPIATFDGDLVVAIGGDGTFLSVLRQTPVPLVALNAGTVGVLAEIDARRQAEVDECLGRLSTGRYAIDDRMKLAVSAGPLPAPDATNEVVVHGLRAAKMVDFEIAMDGSALGRIRADGIIVSTPTGSTGYSLSAFGPIVEPTLEAIVVTAIAPFRAASRALVLDPWRTVSVRAVPEGVPMVCVVDGQEECPVPVGGAVRIYRSPRRARFVRFGTPWLGGLQGKGILPWSQAGDPPPEPEE